VERVQRGDRRPGDGPARAALHRSDPNLPRPLARPLAFRKERHRGDRRASYRSDRERDEACRHGE
jgi:hypothetical protein